MVAAYMYKNNATLCPRDALCLQPKRCLRFFHLAINEKLLAHFLILIIIITLCTCQFIYMAIFLSARCHIFISLSLDGESICILIVWKSFWSKQWMTLVWNSMNENLKRNVQPTSKLDSKTWHNRRKELVDRATARLVNLNTYTHTTKIKMRRKITGIYNSHFALAIMLQKTGIWIQMAAIIVRLRHLFPK